MGTVKAETREKLTTLNIHVERRKMKALNLVIIFYHDNEN